MPATPSLSVGARGEAGDGRLDRVARSHLLASLALVVLCLLAFLPGYAALPPMDRDEPRFAQASKQMLETGDAVNIRFQDEARLKKPVGIYWMQAAAAWSGERLAIPEARTRIWLYRVPSLLGAIAAVLLTRWAALALVGPRAALMAGAMMTATVLLGVEARLATTDAVLLASVTAMIGALARVAPGSSRPARGWAVPAIFWTATAVSVLVKGPIGLLVAALTTLALVVSTREARWFRDLRPLPGLAWAVVLVAPWFIAIMVATHGRFFEDSVGRDMMAKVAGGQESHGAPPGVYFAAFWLTFWPAAPLAALAAPWAWRQRRSPAVRFLLCWLVPSWILFEAVPTKLPHYVLPLYPALAMLVAAAIDADGLASRRWARIVALLIPVLAVATPIAGAGAVWHYEGRLAWPLLAVAVLAGMLASRAWRLLPTAPRQALGWTLAAALVMSGGVYALGVPAVPSLWPSPRMAAVARSLDCPSPAYASVGYHEPSLVFLLGTDLQLPDTGREASDFLAQGGCRMVFVGSRQEPEFQARLAETGRRADLLARVNGVNLNGGRRLDIGAYRAAP